jgi:hypothetical protein
MSNAEGAPGLNQIPALSFIAGTGYVALTADGDTAQGADHLNFKLDAEVGIIILSDPALVPIDIISYGPQFTDVSQGRSPSGSDTIVGFAQPTPGGPNPAGNGGFYVTAQVVTLITPTNFWRWDNSGGTNLSATWLTNGFNDSAWSNSLPLFGFETTPNEYLPYTFPANSFIPAPGDAGGHITVYFRTHFQWNGSLTNFSLVSTNYIDDGVAYYLNGV